MPPLDSDAHYDCIVLGAGIAGAVAARDLQKTHNLKTLLIEGSERIGGRIHSKRGLITAPGTDTALPLEAGAQYVHVGRSETYKEFWDEIDAQGFTTEEFHKSGFRFPFTTEPRNHTYFEEWGETRVALNAILDRDVFRVIDLLYDVRKFDPYLEPDISARAFIRAIREEERYSGQSLVLADYVMSAHTPGMLDDPPPGHPPDQHNPHDTISVAGISADNIPNQLLDAAEYRLIRKGASWPEKVCGNDSLPKSIVADFEAAGGEVMKSADAEHDMKVVRVAREEDGNLWVETKDGTTYSARAAISTFSVGMLDPVAGEGAAIFGDLLTPAKRDALRTICMGPITKFSLVFKERVWAEAGRSAERMTVLSHPGGEARTFFSSFPDRPDAGPHVLTGLLMSKDHERIHSMNDADAIQHLLDVLCGVYGKSGERWTAESHLVGTHDADGTFQPLFSRRDWENDPFAKGGNSYLRYVPDGERTVAVTGAREILKNPRETLPLFWAGEATAPAYDPDYQPLSIHGAYISGVRAATDLAHYLTTCDGDAERFKTYYTERYAELHRERPFGEWLSNMLINLTDPLGAAIAFLRRLFR